MKHVTAAGIDWQVVRVWNTGTRTRERQLKNRGHAEKCPRCPDGWQRPHTVKES